MAGDESGLGGAVLVGLILLILVLAVLFLAVGPSLFRSGVEPRALAASLVT